MRQTLRAIPGEGVEIKEGRIRGVRVEQTSSNATVSKREEFSRSPIADADRLGDALKPGKSASRMRVGKENRNQDVGIEAKAHGSSSRISLTNVAESAPRLGRASARRRICAMSALVNRSGAGEAGVRLTTGLPWRVIVTISPLSASSTRRDSWSLA